MKIAVYAICKNEEKFIDSWINNMLAADYICILDTGSADNTYNKLQEIQQAINNDNPGKIILEQKEINPWRFDVARNESMKLVPEDAECLVCTDFDELFNEDWCDILRANWIEGETNRCYYNYAWSHNKVGEPSDIFIYDKIHSRELKWVFPVHEVLYPIDENNYDEHPIDLVDSIMLQHYQDKDKSRSSYFELLKLAVEENPNNPHERMLLAREYLLNKDYDNALKEYLNTLEMPEIDNPDFRSVLLESLGRCADIYQYLQNYDEAIWYCQEFIKEDPTYREPYFLLGEMYNDMKMYTLAKAVVEAGFKYSTRKYSWVERANTWLGSGEDILSIACYYLGEIEDAIKNVKIALSHDPENPHLLKNYITFLESKTE